MRDFPWLGAIFTARADLEDELGHFDDAVAMELLALRYKYQRPDLESLAISHRNLAIYLTRPGQDPATAVAHGLAAVLLYGIVGRFAEIKEVLQTVAIDVCEQGKVLIPRTTTRRPTDSGG